MISTIASNLQNSPKPLVLTPTRLEDNFKKNKFNLAIFKELKEGDKLGKEIKDEKPRRRKPRILKRAFFCILGLRALVRPPSFVH